MSKEEDEHENLWDERRAAIGKQLLSVIAETPSDLIVQGRKYKVEVRAYDGGVRAEAEGCVGIIVVSGDTEHFDFSIQLDGWGSLRSMPMPTGEDEEE